MIRLIIVALFAFIFLGLAVMWIASGGIGRTYSSLKAVSDVGTSTGRFTLPWQPQVILPGFIAPGLESVIGESGAAEELARLEAEYDELNEKVRDSQTFGDPSPFFGNVRVVGYDSDPKRDHPSAEYVTITAQSANTAPVSLAGWSLMSSVTGVRAPLPFAASRFRAGIVNARETVSLNPGDSVIVLSGFSPVGASFRENRCSGYLSQFQEFTPSFSPSCPSPSEEMPLTAENLSVYGELCVDAARDVPECTNPQVISRPVTAACRHFLQSVLSYNGCINRHDRDRGFYGSEWRLFFESPRELWLNTHDALRLLDDRGQTVDVYVY